MTVITRETGGPGPAWIRSSLSYANGNCVEVASLAGGAVGVRDSKDRAGPVLVFAPRQWRAFVAGTRGGVT
jgi:hypothetical protein